MKIWVDADACPVVVKEIIFRAATRTGLSVTLVANQTIKIPHANNISFLKVNAGFDVADDEIVRRLCPGDLVITADIPLASEILGKGGMALSPRGELFTEDNIKRRLSMRDLMDTLRSGGLVTGGPPPLGQTDRKKFAGQFDKLLTRYGKS